MGVGQSPHSSDDVPQYIQSNGMTLLCFLCFQDMITALKAALSGSLETVVLGLMRSTAQYDASEIRGSIKVRDVEGLQCPLLGKKKTKYAFIL